MKILISGGAGFVGSTLAELFRKQFPKAQIVALDNLRRRGSELNLPRLKSWGVDFQHGDIRKLSDLQDLNSSFDVFVEASAEPSVLAGQNGSPSYVLETNLNGTINCLEYARKNCGKFIFLSSSRVYSIPALRNIPLKKGKTRFEIDFEQAANMQGLTTDGVTENFPTTGFRSLYGATKLASELLVEEYVQTYKLKAVINRCGVLAGPWQMGKVDQGVFTLWMAQHVFGGKLSYIGFEGSGLQVRDLLHPRDLFDLLMLQISGESWDGSIYNIGGGLEGSVSLLELTKLCQEISGREIPVGLTPETNSVDIPLYISDSNLAKREFGWQPQTNVRTLMAEIHQWLTTPELKGVLESLFLPGGR